MATKTPAARATRPGRAIGFLLLLLIGLNIVVFANGWRPRQGLDLVGGTSVILTPKGANPPAGALTSAVDIIRQRVNGTGVTSAEVVREGQNVRVSLPSVGRAEALRIIGTTAELTFRPVLQTVGPGPATPQTPAPTATPTARPTGSPTARPTATATATTRPRPVTGVLLPGQAPTPTPTATPTATPRPTGTATPIAPADDAPLTIEQAMTTIDCSDAEGRERIRESFGRPEKNKEQIVSCDVNGDAKYLLGPAEMTGRDIDTATATISTGGGTTIPTGQWVVSLEMKSASKWGELTEKYVGQQLAIVLDGLTQSAPSINEKIPDGNAEISGSFTEKSARELANVLKYGALPVQFEQSQTQTISPTLGERSLDGALLAGLLGLALVLLYAIFYYRALGLVTIVGMLIFAALNWLAIVILGETMGFTITLAGIAGLIVSVGISADSYVVFYERLRDEVRSGRSVQQGVARGFTRAFQTILTADAVSFLAALILYWRSAGEVRGFAFTLGLATIIDVTVAWFYTRPVVTMLARTKMFREGRFGGLAGTHALATKEA